MKKTRKHAITTALVTALLASNAIAGTTIDKGSLGKYERQGRFVKPIFSPVARGNDRARPAALETQGRVLVDKGERGRYERKGPFLRPIVENVQNNWTGKGRVLPEGSIRHMHGLNGKSHQNVKLGLPNR